MRALNLIIVGAYTAFSLHAQAASPQLGDLDHDGIATVRDLVLLRNHMNAVSSLSDDKAVLADLTKDGVVNQSDADEIVKEILQTRTPEQLPLASIREVSPSSGEGDVAVTRETVLHFSMPLALNSAIDTNKFKAEFGGRKILSRVEVSSDRKKATLFYLEPLPSNARVRVSFDSAGVNDLLGRAIDGDGDGTAGGTYASSFDTLSITAVAGTAISGRVFASERGTGGNEVPLAGVTVTVDGGEQNLRTTTDAMGNFTLSPCPAGTFFVHIDGRTSPQSSYPAGDYFPSVGKRWEAIAGRTDNLSGNSQDTTRGTIYLPCICDGSLEAMSQTQDTPVDFPAEVLTARPDLAGTRLIVPANSLFADDGTRGGQVGIAPVAPDRLPSPLPPGLNLPMVITIQTDGATNFDRPVPICFPNLPDPVTREKLPPGAKSALWSFNHDLGDWEVVGPMTVTEDGNFVKTDAGVGVRQPGWHGQATGATPSAPPGGKNCPGDCFQNAVEKCLELGLQVPTGPEAAFLHGAFHKCRDKLQKECENCKLGVSTKSQSLASSSDEAIVQELATRLSAISTLLYPYTVQQIEPSTAVKSQVDQLVAEMDTITGGSYKDFIKLILSQSELSLGPGSLGPSNAPRRPIAYAAFISINGVESVIRGRTNADGSYRLIVPSIDAIQMIMFYDSESNRWGFSTPRIRADLPFRLPPIFLVDAESDLGDFDGDTIIDVAESVLGTSPKNSDTDSDGIPDGVEIKQGTDPLSGLAVSTGIVSSAPTPSVTLDIAAANGIAVVAHGSSGFTLFNVLAGLNPGRLLQQDTQGFAQAVALSGSYALIADREGGAVILDLRDQEILLDPSRRSAALVPVSVGGQATAVATDGVTGYVGTSSGQIVVLDLAARREVARFSLPDGATVEDLQIEGDRLYALQTGTLRVLSISGPTLAVQGSLGLSMQRSNMQVRFRLFVGNGLAYATHSRGYHLVDVSTPTAPSLIRSHSDNQFGWKHVIQNGSGLGLACASPNSTPDGPHHLSLYSVGADGRSSDFLTTIETPGIATAVSVYNGLAYVADGSAGLQVVNYRAFDTLRVPPTIQLASNFNLAGGSAEEGKRMRLTATVTDDVQVRNVEFYVDGQLSATDGNFPFEHAFLTPVRSAEKQTFIVRAKATDTGGNTAWSTEYRLNLIPDATPPTVASISPPNNTLVGAITDAFVVFSEPMDVDSLTSGIQVTSAGPDGTLGNGDDVAIAPTLSWRSTTNTAFITFTNALTPGRYQIRVAAPAADSAGNALASATTSAIRVFSFTDTDNDGMADDWEPLLGLTVGDDDSDNDGILDGAEDFDNDGLSNAGELVLNFDPRNRDTNGNGINDGLEDIDQDGLSNQQEFLAGTNPNLPDTDGDGWKDGDELLVGSDPTNPNSRPNLFIASAPPVTAMRFGNAGDLTSAGSVIQAQPAVTVLRISTDAGGGLGNGAVQAAPPVFAVRFGTGADIASAGSIIKASPDVTVMRFGTGEDLTSAGSIIKATPDVTVMRFGNGDDITSNGSVIQAVPSVNVLRIDASLGAASAGTILASPGVQVLNGADSIIAKPPVAVQIQP